MNRYDKLRLAMTNVSNKVAKEGKLKGKDLITNQRVKTILTATTPVTSTSLLGTRIDARGLCLVRTGFQMQRSGIKWPELDLKEIEQWLYDNWDKVLRVLVSIIALFVI
jgi:hypothetical protein